ncbi:MAG: flagellar motor switch protein FliN [Planctomycetota bacterium]|jgi:flagellar motor switch protein FliN/FliY
MNIPALQNGDPAETSDPSDGIPSDGNVPVAAFHLLRDVEVEITLEIGRRRMRIADVLKLAPGQILPLSKAAGEPLDIYINGRLLGRGEAVVLGDRYGVRITELVAPTAGRPA